MASAAGAPGLERETAGLALDKPVYTISVASEILETHPRTLMMYENLGLIAPQRTSTNRRRFSQRDIIRLQVIQMLTRKHGVNLAGVRDILSLLEVLIEARVAPPPDLAPVLDRYRETL
jgi:MerR family transcriptional regulator/heat shock protein HspR